MKKIEEEKKNLKNFSSLKEIVDHVKNSGNVKFNESIDIAIGLGINSKKTDENIRGSFILANGIPKKLKIAVFASSLEQDIARKAGADVVGLEDLVEEIKKKEKVDFDVYFATIEALPKIIPIAKILGQSGVMPNKKDGTVTNDIAKSIKEVKEGKKCVFRSDSSGYIHLRIGKSDIDTEKICENIMDFVNYVRTLKPPKVKEMIKKVHISSTMGMGLNINLKYL